MTDLEFGVGVKSNRYRIFDRKFSFIMVTITRVNLITFKSCHLYNFYDIRDENKLNLLLKT